MSPVRDFISWSAKTSPVAKFWRTIFQGTLAILIIMIPQAIYNFYLPTIINLILVIFLTATLSLIQAKVGSYKILGSNGHYGPHIDENDDLMTLNE